MSSLHTEIHPRIEAAASVLEKAFRSRHFVLVVGYCRVDYAGRAASKLGWGERVVIVKQDGSVLVHRPVGYEPVNWQPPRCLVKVAIEDPGSLVISASRSAPRETVKIEFADVKLTATGNLNDQGEFSLHVTEEQMKQAILAAPTLIEDGLNPLQEEKGVADAGFTDIYAEDKDGNLVVLEIKRTPASKDAVMQLNRYLENLKIKVDKPIRGIVVAPQLRKNAQTLLFTLKLEYVRLAPDKCFAVLKGQKDMKLNQFLHYS